MITLPGQESKAILSGNQGETISMDQGKFKYQLKTINYSVIYRII